MIIRAAPGLRSDALYGILPGTCGIKLTGTCRAGWCPVAIDSFRGWVDRAELE
jgi:SH3-like domain-containing protein